MANRVRVSWESRCRCGWRALARHRWVVELAWIVHAYRTHRHNSIPEDFLFGED